MKKAEVETFEVTSKPFVVSERNTKVIVKNESYIFHRLLIAAKHRNIDLKKVLTYELSAIPSSFALPDGTMNKGTKSQVLHVLETFEKGVKELPPSAGHTLVYVVDGMAIIHMLNNAPKTFGELAHAVFTKLHELYEVPQVIRIDHKVMHLSNFF